MADMFIVTYKYHYWDPQGPESLGGVPWQASLEMGLLASVNKDKSCSTVVASLPTDYDPPECFSWFIFP